MKIFFQWKADALVAQLAERMAVNHQVGGPSPP